MKLIRVIVLCLTIISLLSKFGFCKNDRLKIIEGTESGIVGVADTDDVWYLLSKIFEYEESVTVISDSLKIEYFGTYDVFIRILQTKLNISLEVIDISKLSITGALSTDKLNKHSGKTNTSYILVMGDRNKYYNFFQALNFNSSSLNTRARYVFFAESQSFSNIHKHCQVLWKKFQISKVITYDRKSGKIVAFNYLKDQIKVFNRTDVEKILEYTYASKKYLNGYPIKVSMASDPPTSIAIPNSTRFDGVNQHMLDTLQSLMNFTAVMTKLDYRSGTFKPVIDREVQLIANMKFITSHNESGFEFTTPFFTERLYFIVPKAERVPIWLSMYHVFNNSIWIPTACLFATCVVFWFCILKFHQNPRIERLDVGSIIINVLFLLTGQTVSRRLKNYLERVLVMCGSIFAIIMVNTFAGHLFQQFSGTAYYPEINSLEELEKSGLPLTAASDDVITAVSGSEDQRLKNLLKKINISNDITTAFDIRNGVFDRAVLSWSSRLRYEIAKNVIKNNGSESLYKMEKTLGRFSMAYIVPQGSIFLSDFNSNIHKILESGLIKKWYYDSIFNHTSWMRRLQSISYQDLPRAFTLSDLRLAWFVLTVGLTISFVTFLIEIAW